MPHVNYVLYTLKDKNRTDSELNIEHFIKYLILMSKNLQIDNKLKIGKNHQ